MKLPSNIKFINENTKEIFYNLENKEEKLFKFLNNALDNIEKNAFCGVQIPKKLIPKDYRINYNVKNLWKYNLPEGWRLMYSIVNDQIVVISLVLEWLDHKEYEKRFNY